MTILYDDMTLEYHDIPKNAHFMPHEDPSRIEMLLDKVTKGRQSDLLTMFMEVLRRDPSICKETGLYNFISAFLNFSSQDRRQLAQYPPFFIWLNKCILMFNNDIKDYPRQRLSQHVTIMEGFRNSKTNSSVCKVPGSSILVQRFGDVDPIIKDVSGPAYEFPDKQRQQELEKVICPLSFFSDVVSVALDRIRHTWPDAYSHTQNFVKIICHVPDALFRASSSAGKSGVIYLSSNYKSILDLEESLIHECSHQVLYDVNEIFPLIKSKVSKTFKLPWSGRERDWYGLLNAFYIYINLAHYFNRFEDRQEEDQRWAYNRKTHILDGLIKAIPEIEENAEDFTPSGRELFRVLKYNVKELNGQTV